MTARTEIQTIPPFPRFSRFSLGLGIKSHSVSPRPSSRRLLTKKNSQDDDWYIPYNGPYEKPQRKTLLHQRDSWGDLVDNDTDKPKHNDDDDVDAILGDNDLHIRYGHDNDNDSPRNRALSGFSNQTRSSAAVDPHRNSAATRRRSTVSHGKPVSSYINLDAAGGVGESPMPQQRLAASQQQHQQHPNKIANFFTFNSNSNSNSKKSSPSKPEKLQDRSSSAGTSSPLLRSSSSSDQKRMHARGRRDNTSDYTPIASSSAPSSPPFPRHPYAYVFPSDALNASFQNPPGPAPRFPPVQEPSLHQRILLTGPKRTPTNQAPLPDPAPTKPFFPHARALKPSLSSPNLRSAVPPPQLKQPQPQSKLKDRWFSVETWCDAILFPRPRFKLREEGGGSGSVSPLEINKPLPGIQSRVLAHSRSVADIRNHAANAAGAGPSTSDFPSSRRRVATLPNDQPPPFPAARNDPFMTADEQPKSFFAQDDLALPSPVPSLTRVLEEGQQLDKMRKQWQSQATESFQNKRTRSISRTRSKSLTSNHPRARRREGENNNNKVSEHIDFLAERTFLGNQTIRPSIRSKSTTTATVSSISHSHSHSHSHSNSVAKTSSKTSGQRAGFGHSRNESWSHSARKMAATFCGLNGDASLVASDDEGSAMDGVLKGNSTKVIVLADPAMAPPIDIGSPTMPSATVGPVGGVIALESRQDGVSPAPTGSSFEGVGIALSTPPPPPPPHDDEGEDEQEPEFSNPFRDNEPIRFIDHPYAQGGGSYPPPPPRIHIAPPVLPPPPPQIQQQDSVTTWGSDYAGPHPSSSHMVAVSMHSDVSSRHRLPPQATLHPYAQAGAGSGAGASASASSPDSYQGVVPYLRADSDVPPPAKMWARLSQDKLREILPSEIQYSPYSPPVAEGYSPGDGPVQVPLQEQRQGQGQGQKQKQKQKHRKRQKQVQSDAVSVGEALSYAILGGPGDSGHDMGLLQAPVDGGDEAEPPSHIGKGVQVDPIVVDSLPDNSNQDKKVDDDNDNENDNAIIEPSPLVLSPTTTAAAIPVSPPGTDPRPHSTGSPGVASQSSSPQLSPRPFGGVDDLDHFRDLFYKPSSLGLTQRMSPIEMMPPPVSREVSMSTTTSGDLSTTWEIATRRRTGSGLTSLARQLSEELEELNAQMELGGLGLGLGGGNGESGVSSRYQSGLRFVLTEGESSPTRDTSPLRLAGTAAAVGGAAGAGAGLATAEREKLTSLSFHPSENIPEDVESSRASSILERSEANESNTEIYRVGIVEPVTTPPITDGTHHRRLSGHLSLIGVESATATATVTVAPEEGEEEDENEEDSTVAVRERIKSESSLMPSAGLTRSSYMTNSTNASRMSGLSDFPVPPTADMTANIKLLDVFFDGPPRMIGADGDGVGDHSSTSLASGGSPQQPISRRMTFGGDEDIEDIAKSLSSPSP